MGVAVSVVVPVTERPEDLEGVYHEFSAPLRASGRTFEFLFVAEPSFADLTAGLRTPSLSGERIRVLLTGQVIGEAALLKLAVGHARAPILVTLPAYPRVTAAALPALVERVERGADLVVARRWPRRDGWVNRAQNWVFHFLLGRLTGGRVHDVACGVRAMRRQVLEELPLYGDFFRFLPLLALREGYRVEELAVPQHEADTRLRLYGPGIYVRRIFDVFGLFFLLRFTEKPLRFFGLLGSTLAVLGLGTLAVLFVQRLAGQAIANRPVLLLGVLLIVLGIQAIALGLVGEIIVHLHAGRRPTYRLARDDPPPA